MGGVSSPLEKRAKMENPSGIPVPQLVCDNDGVALGLSERGTFGLEWEREGEPRDEFSSPYLLGLDTGGYT